MIGPKTDNSLGTGDGNTQIGHNTGTIQIGLPFEQHEAALERAIARKEQDLERAHTAEKALIQRELDALRLRMLDLDGDYQARLVELAETKALLQRYDNQIDRARYDEAIAALDRDETALAEAILTELATRASQRRDDAAREEAKLVFKLGEIAEGRVDWAAAARHHARAAELAPDFGSLYKARALAFRVGDYQAALHFGEELLRFARTGADRRQLATALNEYAVSLGAIGRYAEAEPLFREALEIGRASLGPRDPDVAATLNNFAELLRATGRLPEAEPLFRDALEIGRETLGSQHPNISSCLSNLAGLLKEMGQWPEAELLYREALDIGRSTLSSGHPDLAILINNFAGFLKAKARMAEAAAMAVEALGIARASLGDSHPHTRKVAENTLRHLREHAPDHPDLPGLADAFPAL